MSGNNTGSNPFTGLIGSGYPSTPTAIQNQSALSANQYGWAQTQPITWTTSGTTYSMLLPLTPETAKDLMAQLEHDKVLVADHKLLFGQYMGKSLREIPLEYIVQLGAAMRGARIQVAKELRRRRALERLTLNKGRV